jgi:predicted nucleotidyltransferase
MRLLFVKSGKSFNARGMAKALKVSPTAISKSLGKFGKEDLIIVKKDKETGRLSIDLNRSSPEVIALKRVENLKMIYESGLVGFLSEGYPGSTIILFGSYSFGEDTLDSDIDIAVIGSKPIIKTARLEKFISRFEELLERKINISFYADFKGINKYLKENILNGIVLKGGIEL